MKQHFVPVQSKMKLRRVPNTAAAAAAAIAIAGMVPDVLPAAEAFYDEDEYGPYYPYSPSPYGAAVSCAFQPNAQLNLFDCITPGTAICRDGWKFGIDGRNENFVKLWNPKGMAVYADFPGGRKLCIGERSGEYTEY